jgi:FkbM family methyltransferase
MAESPRARARRFINRFLHPCGLHLARRAASFEMDDLLAQAASRGVRVNTWIDVGASDGQWSLRTHRHFPDANFLLFEPLAERQCALSRLKKSHGFIPVAAAAGSSPGIIDFVIDPALDGSGVAPRGTTQAVRGVPVDTIDRVISSHQLAGPYGIKLDTHGHEIAVLDGASSVLAEASLVIIEAYNFQLSPDSLRFHELCAWMETRGFRCCDLADPMRRPGDGALWQLDLAFMRSEQTVFGSNRYE